MTGSVGVTVQSWHALRPASLAQSVERFHGKEKVNSSILLGGSTKESRSDSLAT